MAEEGEASTHHSLQARQFSTTQEERKSKPTTREETMRVYARVYACS